MLPQIADFSAEADELNALLETLSEADWERVTLFKAWTINDVIQHLHAGDLMAAASATGAAEFAAHRSRFQALRDSGLSRLEATRRQMDGLTGHHLRATWHAQVRSLCRLLASLPLDARLQWAGPDMGLRMFTTARQMET